MQKCSPIWTEAKRNRSEQDNLYSISNLGAQCAGDFPEFMVKNLGAKGDTYINRSLLKLLMLCVAYFYEMCPTTGLPS